MYEALCIAFPRGKVKKKAYIMDDTFRYICEASNLRKRTSKTFKRFNNSTLWAAFGIWANKPWRCKWSIVWAFGRAQTLKTWNGARKAIAFLEPVIKDMLVLESLAFFDKAADMLVESSNSADDKTFFKCINDCLSIANSKTKDPKCMRIIDKSIGKPTQNVVQEKHAFREHFSDLMGGEVGTYASLIHKDRDAPASRFSGIDLSRLADVVPTFFDLFNCYAKFVGGKATGESRIASDVFRKFPMLMAKVYYPLVLKTYMRISPRYNGKEA